MLVRKGFLRMQEGEQFYNTTLFLRIWAGIFGAVGLPVGWLNGFSLSLLLVGLASLLPAAGIYLVVSRIGEGIVSIFDGGGGLSHKEARFAAELDKAKYLLRQGSNADAEAILVKILETEVQHDQTLFMLAKLCMQKGAWKEARAHLRTIVLSPDAEQQYRNWARQLLQDDRALERQVSEHTKKKEAHSA